MSVTTQILDNNVLLITEPVEGVKTASIGFWFRTGSRFESAETRGVTHFVEHMLFKGTKTRSPFDIAVSFDRIGGYINAFTERENMCVHCVVPSAHVETALEVMCDMTQNSVFASEELERERDVIISEIISSQDDPEEAALDAASEAIWPGHPVSASIAGSVEDVQKLTRDSLLNWYEKYVVSGSLVVCVSGCVNEKSIAQNLSKLPSRIIPDYELPKDKVISDIWRSGKMFTKAPFRQMQFFLQLPLKIYKTDKIIEEADYYALLILNAIIGDTMSSRLFQALREKGGFCYNVYSFLTYYSDTACWCAYASASKKDSVRVANSLVLELKKLKEFGFTQEELSAACEHLCGEEIIASEEMEYIMKRLFRNYSFGFAQRSPEETVDYLRNITKDKIEKIMDSLLDFSQANLLVYGTKPSLFIQNKIKAISL